MYSHVFHRWAWKGFAPLVLCVGVMGCASFFDEVTSREFKMQNLWTREDPLIVLRDSTDGEKRARALASLKEPLRNGGNEKDQDVYLKILSISAKEDREPYCRLCAIRALSKFKDARATKVLEDVYTQSRLPFTPEFNSMIRQEALASLENTPSEDVRKLLIRVARQPGPPNDASLTDRQQTQDEKLAAIRALARQRHPESAQTLVHILETEKDVALRTRAQESLREMTGKNLPADAVAWKQAINGIDTTIAQEPRSNPIQQVGSWLKWGN